METINDRFLLQHRHALLLLHEVVLLTQILLKYEHTKFEALTAVKMSIVVFWVVKPCWLVRGDQRFGFRPKEEGNMFHRNVRIHLQADAESKPGRSPWIIMISCPNFSEHVLFLRKEIWNKRTRESQSEVSMLLHNSEVSISSTESQCAVVVFERSRV
jgi:hypothetical protein